ncbi:MAG: 2Fe-2S iron-sulfur cluster-binding protein [Cyclobacteriaceae bacterium]
MINIILDNLQSKRIISKDKSEKLLHILLRETDWMHACGGKGKCTSCKMKILEGADNLSEITEAERKYRKMNKLQMDERLACQVSTHGDLRIRVQKENQLPHLTYSK